MFTNQNSFFSRKKTVFSTGSLRETYATGPERNDAGKNYCCLPPQGTKSCDPCNP